MTQSVESFFEGGATAAKFTDQAFGSVIGGEIIADPRMVQQKDYTTSDLLFYPDGNPQMQMVVTVQAQPPDGDDDGQRAFYIKGQMKQAVGEALRKAGAKTPARGGRLHIKYIEDKPTTLKNGKPGNPQKIYAAKYEPPAVAAGGAYFDEAPAPATYASPAPATSAPTPAVADLMRSGGTRWPECPPGVDPGKWNVMTSEQRAQMYAAFGLDVPQAAAFAGEPPF